MKKVILQGHLGDKYGSEWNMKADTFGEVFGCIDANYPGFRQDLIDIAEAGGDIDISVAGVDIDVEEMFYPVSNEDVIIITPIPTGAKSGGAKIFAAVALVVAAFVFAPVTATFAALAAGQFGWTAAALLTTFAIASSLALSGLEQIMSPDPSVDTDERDYLFTGAENNILRGTSVPVLFGEMVVGGIVISNAIKSGTFSSQAGNGHSTHGSTGGTGSSNGIGAEDGQVAILPGGWEGDNTGLHVSLIEGNGGYAMTQDVLDEMNEIRITTGTSLMSGNISPGSGMPEGIMQGQTIGGDLFETVSQQLSMEEEGTDLLKRSININLGD